MVPLIQAGSSEQVNSGPPKNTVPRWLAPDVVCSQQGTKESKNESNQKQIPRKLNIWDGEGVWALLIYRSEEGESGRGLTENRVVSRVWGNQDGWGGVLSL